MIMFIDCNSTDDVIKEINFHQRNDVVATLPLSGPSSDISK